MRKLVLFLMIALALPACAQVFNMESDRVQMAPLGGFMRFHTGDDQDGKLGWSAPGFDDSNWPLISSESDWSAQGYKDYGGFAWYRFKVILPQDHRQLGLYIPRILTSYQVFADGKQVGSFGGFPPNATIYTLHQHLVLLPRNSTGEIEIAIRVWHWPDWATYYGGGLSAAPRIGDPTLLKQWMKLQDRETFWELSAGNYSALLNLLYGFAGFVLYAMRRKEHMYLWYGLSGFFFGAQYLVGDYASFHDVPQFASDASINLLAAAGFVTFVIFIWTILGARRAFWVWLAVATIGLNAAIWILPAGRHLTVSVGDAIIIGIDLPLSIGPLAMLIQGVRRRDPDARLLLVPVGFNTLANWIDAALRVIHASGHPWVDLYWTAWNSTFNWPFTFGLYDLSIWILLLAILGIVVLRFARSRHEEEQLQSEMDAARAVQQILIPEKIPNVPGLHIESVYKPAKHVGGDFFYIRPEEEGGVLIVIGDVSGKGLRAAMTVNSVIGALRTMPPLPPARILSTLNRGLIGQMQGGFVTCCAVRVNKDGNVAIANAGHLAPYLNGAEVSIPAGLPLGVASGVEFQESGLLLYPGSSIALVSDGVVEARNAQGELFGFERTAAISTEPADSIAAAAEAFGQEDDITVLTLIRLPVAPETASAPTLRSRSASLIKP